MSNARNLANLLGTNTQIQTADIADGAFQANKNLIINGDMRIDQRNGGASVTPTSSGYTLDRYQAGLSTSSKFSVQQVADAPDGFVNSLKVTSLASTTPAASEWFFIQQKIEGYNSTQLEFGSSGAKDITASFWVKSSLTGTFGLTFYNGNGSRAYPATYTISVANTWEYKTISISGDTSGTWATNNTSSLQMIFDLGTGGDNSGTAGAWGSAKLAPTGVTQVVATNAATWQITGVQLELGDSATAFEHRSYGDELRRCQRYYVKQESVYGSYHTFGFGTWFSATRFIGYVQMPVPMRTNPSLAVSGSVAAWQGVNPRGTISGTIGIASVGGNGSPTIIELDVTSGLSGSSTGSHGFLKANNDSSALLEFNAEL